MNSSKANSARKDALVNFPNFNHFQIGFRKDIIEKVRAEKHSVL